MPDLAAELWQLSIESVGTPVLVATLVVGVWVTFKRERALVLPFFALSATLAGLCLLAPIARIQPYYAFSALPLAFALLAWFESANPLRRIAELLLALLLSANLLFVLLPALARAGKLWRPPTAVWAPEFARVIARRGHERVATIMHYDAPMLAWSLARQSGVETDWKDLARNQRGLMKSAALGREFAPIMYTHSPGESEERAVRQLDELMREQPLLVVDRVNLPLPLVRKALASCEPLASADDVRLLSCAQRHDSVEQ